MKRLPDRPPARPGIRVETVSLGGRTIRWIVAVWPFGVFLGAWQLWIGAADVSPLVAPSPHSVGAYVVAHVPELTSNAAHTTVIAVAGLGLGVTSGTAAALTGWYSQTLRGVLTPAALVAQAVPVVALIPLLVRVLGFGTPTLIAIAAIIVFFPVFVFSSSGLRAPPPGTEQIFRILGATRWRIMWLLALPSAVPSLLIALRIGASAALLGTMLAEYLMGTSGLGRMVVFGLSDLELERAWSAAVVGGGLSVMAFISATRVAVWGRERWR